MCAPDIFLYRKCLWYGQCLQTIQAPAVVFQLVSRDSWRLTLYSSTLHTKGCTPAPPPHQYSARFVLRRENPGYRLTLSLEVQVPQSWTFSSLSKDIPGQIFATHVSVSYPCADEMALVSLCT